jgi:hypothetical protein
MRVGPITDSRAKKALVKSVRVVCVVLREYL